VQLTVASVGEEASGSVAVSPLLFASSFAATNSGSCAGELVAVIMADRLPHPAPVIVARLHRTMGAADFTPNRVPSQAEPLHWELDDRPKSRDPLALGAIGLLEIVLGI